MCLLYIKLIILIKVFYRFLKRLNALYGGDIFT